MAADKTMTLYRNGQAQDFAATPEMLAAAKAKGWGPQPAPATSNPQAGAQPQAGAPGASPQQGGLPSPGGQGAGGFGKGFVQGANPLHMPPQGTPGIQGAGQLENGLANAFNIPEIMQKFKNKDAMGGAGEIAGTGAGMAMQAGGKVLKEVGLGARAAEDVSRASRSATAGAGLSRELKVPPEVARFAERYIQPLKEAIDSQFEPIHRALEGKAFAIPVPMQRMIRKMAKSEVPAIAKLAEELNGRTALDYQEGKALMEHLKDVVHDEDAKNWKPEAKALTKMLDDEIDTLANKYGFGPQRKTLLRQYTKMQEIMRTVASGASTTEGKVRPVADAISGVGPEASVGGVRVGFRTGSGKAMRVPKEAQVEAQRLGKQLGLGKGDLKVGSSGMEKTGKAMQGAGAGMDMGKLFRLIMTMMQPQQGGDPYAGKQAQ